MSLPQDHQPNPQSIARSPHRMTFRDWIQVSRRVVQQINEDNVGIVAAGVAFFSLLAVFPLISAAVSVYGYFADPNDVYNLIASVSAVLPSEAWSVINEEVIRLVTKPRQQLGFGIFISLFFALFSAGSGVRAVMRSMNIAYGERETRKPLKFFGLAVLMTVAIIVFMWAALGIILGVPAALHILRLDGIAALMARSLPWVLLLFMFGVGTSIVYQYGASRRAPKLRWVMPGVIFSTLCWIGISVGFSIFVTHLGRYDATYGSLSAVIILLIWFWLTALIVITGAELNAELERQTLADSTRGPDKPVGERGARMADYKS